MVDALSLNTLDALETKRSRSHSRNLLLNGPKLPETATVRYLFGTTTNCVPAPRFTSKQRRVPGGALLARPRLNSATVLTGRWFTCTIISPCCRSPACGGRRILVHIGDDHALAFLPAVCSCCRSSGVSAWTETPFRAPFSPPLGQHCPGRRPCCSASRLNSPSVTGTSRVWPFAVHLQMDGGARSEAGHFQPERVHVLDRDCR